MKWCATFNTELGKRQVYCATLRAKQEAITAFQAIFCVYWINGLTVGTAHDVLIFTLFVECHRYSLPIVQY